jgi:hypothetical protein
MERFVVEHWPKIAASCVVLLLGIQLVPVASVGSNPPQRHELQAPAQVRATLQAACFDCHSNETKWPWYSRVAPVSWMIAHHVEDGRAALNFSEWGDRLEEDKQFDREAVWEQVELGTMPLFGYVALHPEAILSDDQKRAIEAWATEAAVAPDEGMSELADDAPRDGNGSGGSANSEQAVDGGAGGSPSGDDGKEGASASQGADEEGNAKARDNGSPSKPKSDDKPPKAAAPSPKPVPKPSQPAPDEPAEKGADTPKSDVYDGPNPCRTTKFSFSNVRAACEKGGKSRAKSLMKAQVKKARENGTRFKCSSCHASQKTYTLAPNAKSDYRKLLNAAK